MKRQQFGKGSPALLRKLSRAQSGGFTLVEVVVALLIITVVASVVFETLSTSRRLSIKADDSLDAVRVLHNVVNNRFVIDQMLGLRNENAERSGVAEGDPGWNYTLRSQPLRLIADMDRDPLDMNALVDMEICVFRAADPGQKMYCIHRWYRSDDISGSQRKIFGSPATRLRRK